jgi:thiamine pyrophosphate-dependent acetolactate synthase large subunit-like protein
VISLTADNSTGGSGPIRHDTPQPGTASERRWGSDAIAETLRALDLPYLALNPGASYRGLHDSLVNHLGNKAPQMLLCLHEESAVSIAQGFAKASDRMMGAVLHSNVGLMHGSMSIFNAWVDRIPMLILGATGPWDANKRRPWIDWMHTASDQGALVRDFTKWDNQPGSIPAAQEALLRAAQISMTAPRGPTYVNLDAALQEAELTEAVRAPDASRYQPPAPVAPSAEALAEAVRLLDGAKNPVILMGRASRRLADWESRVALAEKLQASVLTDTKAAAAFPTDHPLHAAEPGHFLTPGAQKVLREADVILSLDWTDLAGTLKQAYGKEPVAARVINISPDAHVHRGWSHDYQALPPADVYLMCEPGAAVPPLLQALPERERPRRSYTPYQPASEDKTLTLKALAHAVNTATANLPVCLTRLPLGWNGAWRHFRHPLDYTGSDGGGGVGAGPGLTIGAALALKDTDRICVAVIGDGDFLMGNTALWTAAHYNIPCLFIVANNRSFFNDELHQERVARERGRPVENRWIGQQIAGPDIDLANMARSMGCTGIGPVKELKDLLPAIQEGLAAVQRGEVALVDVRVPTGYDSNVSGAPAASQQR